MTPGSRSSARKSPSAVCTECRGQQTGVPGEQLRRRVSIRTRVPSPTSVAVETRNRIPCGDPVVVTGGGSALHRAWSATPVRTSTQALAETPQRHVSRTADGSAGWSSNNCVLPVTTAGHRPSR
uniref:Uncharacterized protein n=1 Tax=Rousettus aegyptiacus TaxID=9407 RepID=A0A7J8FJT9_ROUAE|nr:hypothetical protein HJG63_012158 [Rousettus aegyptiacus]